MIKMTKLLNESDGTLSNIHNERYIIQKNYIGYDAWRDITGEYEDKNYAIEAYLGFKDVLAHRQKNNLEIARLIKRTTIIKEEIINI